MTDRRARRPQQTSFPPGMLRKHRRALRPRARRWGGHPVNYSLVSHRLCIELDCNTSSRPVLSSWVRSIATQASGFSRARRLVKPGVLTLSSFRGNVCHPRLNHFHYQVPTDRKQPGIFHRLCAWCGDRGGKWMDSLRGKQAGRRDPSLPCPPQVSGQTEPKDRADHSSSEESPDLQAHTVQSQLVAGWIYRPCWNVGHDPERHGERWAGCLHRSFS